MQKSTIVSIAAVCGITVFVWVLVARTPPPGPVVIGRGRGGGGSLNTSQAVTEWPDALASMEKAIQQSGDRYEAWFKLATLREEAGDDAGATAAWDKTADLAIVAEG